MARPNYSDMYEKNYKIAVQSYMDSKQKEKVIKGYCLFLTFEKIINARIESALKYKEDYMLKKKREKTETVDDKRVDNTMHLMEKFKIDLNNI